MRRSLVLLVATARKSAASPECSFSGAAYTSVLDATAAVLEAHNHSVRRLGGSPLLPWNCADDNPMLRAEAGCFFQNPASPYAFLDAPRSDEGPFADEPTYNHFRLANETTGRHRNHQWRIATNEAIIMVGCTPPPMMYFGFAPLLASRHSSNGKLRRLVTSDPSSGRWEVVAGSIGDAVNMQNIQLHENHGQGLAADTTRPAAYPNPFNAPFALVISASPEAETEAIRALAAAVGGARPNLLRIPGRLRERDALFRSADINLGLTQYADLFEILIRFAFPERCLESLLSRQCSFPAPNALNPSNPSLLMLPARAPFGLTSKLRPSPSCACPCRRPPARFRTPFPPSCTSPGPYRRSPCRPASARPPPPTMTRLVSQQRQATRLALIRPRPPRPA